MVEKSYENWVEKETKKNVWGHLQYLYPINTVISPNILPAFQSTPSINGEAFLLHRLTVVNIFSRGH